tara:strand:- start:92 stop:610 length:519 start_codon:yes stop_codon:yes gene_type:complete
MKRRNAIKNIGFITGGIFLLPYSCNSSPGIVYSNLPLIKRREQELIGQICNVILAEDTINFSTPEKREFFVLTMINDCGSSREITILTEGLKSLKTYLTKEQKIDLKNLEGEQIIKFIKTEFESKTKISEFLNLLKKYSMLHFETSENYLTQYLNYEFMPGKYSGRVIRTTT